MWIYTYIHINLIYRDMWHSIIQHCIVFYYRKDFHQNLVSRKLQALENSLLWIYLQILGSRQQNEGIIVEYGIMVEFNCASLV